MTDNQTCATCRHWGAGYTLVRDEHNDTFGTEPDANGHRMCSLTVLDSYWDEHERAAQRLAYVEDSDHEPNGLWTRSDFGCVQWKAKPAES